MSVDSVASSVQSQFQYQPVQSSDFTGPPIPTSAPASSAPAASAPTKLTGSLQSLTSDIQNLLVQLQSQSGNSATAASVTTEAGNPTQPVQGPHHHRHHGGTDQANARAPGQTATATTSGATSSSSGAVAQSLSSAASLLTLG